MSEVKTGTVTLRVISVPRDTPPEDSIYVAGNFNDWSARDEDSKLSVAPDGTFEISIPAEPGERLLYKFTRGSWNTVETDEAFGHRADREVLVDSDDQQSLEIVEAWHDLANTVKRATMGAIEVIREFPMPQLGRSRRVWVYLPPNYETSDRRYPVLYMQDGQNLFDESTSFSGEWFIDHAIETLYMEGKTTGVIVVAPDNGGPSRLDEYSPWKDRQGGGRGDAYLDFVVHTLKPFIDMTFRTLRDRRHTGLAGSSMGGLIALYGGVRYADVFSRIGALSPAFWFANRKIHDVVRAWGKQGTCLDAGPMRFYLDVGGREGSHPEDAKTEVQDTLDMFYLLKEIGFPDESVKLVFEDTAAHTESAWARRFRDAFLWMWS